MKHNKIIPVTKPFLPPVDEYQSFLSGIWNRNWLSNDGPLVKQFENEVVKYLGVQDMAFVANGTIALQIAMKLLNLEKEVITTPFSFVATSSSIVWEGLKPVFVDIDKETLNIDPQKIEGKITQNTSAIIATHVYGNPCDIEAIDSIASKYNLKVIYDAAHCFGTQYKGKSVFEYGDLSIASFHATKLMHSVEGGGIFSPNGDLINRARFMRNFGFAGPEDFNELGINGKNSEMHAAMGLVNLRYANDILKKRRELCEYYTDKLKNTGLKMIKVDRKVKFNYAYYPIVFESEKQLLETVELLNKEQIFPRRYFFPPLTQLPYVEFESLEITDGISKKVLCMPLFHDLSFKDIDRISELVKGNLNKERCI